LSGNDRKAKAPLRSLRLDLAAILDQEKLQG
jgi:hypothetical protein